MQFDPALYDLLTDAEKAEIDTLLLADIKEACEKPHGGLREFVRYMWPVVEPAIPLVWGIHLDIVCSHLEAVTNGDIKRLLINIPPGHSKSILVDVFWPAFEWGPRNMPSMRYIAASYSEDITMRDNMRFRDLIRSNRFQSFWGDRFAIRADQDSKMRIGNDKTGWKIATSVGGVGTGERGSRVICLPYDEMVWTERGKLKIGAIVNQKMNIRVWSLNTKTGKTELKPIEAWLKNPGSDIVEIGLSDGSKMRCTPNHKIWTKRGWIEAQHLEASDVSPCPAVLDAGDGVLVDAVAFGQTPVAADGIIKDNAGLFGGQLGAGGVYSSSAAPKKWFRNGDPRPAGSNCINGRWPDAETCRQYFRRFIAFCNFNGLLLRQDRTGPVFHNRKRAVLFGIGNILRPGAIFKIAKRVIHGLSIQMPHLMPWRRWPNKSQHHGLMHECMMALSAFAGIEPRIPFAIARNFQNLAAIDHRETLAHRYAWFASDASMIADAVKPIKTNDRSPVFIRHVGHVEETFCLTVKDNHDFIVGTGQGIVVANCDDAHNIKDAESDAIRANTLQWWREVVPTRLNDPEKSAIVVIMQRVHEDDVSGDIIKRNLGYDHLCLPAVYEADRPRIPTSIGFVDPRTEDGELLWPERFNEEVLADLKNAIGKYAFASQFQQSPSPRGGGLIKEADWQIWPPVNQEAQWMKDGMLQFPVMEYIIAAFDGAYTEKQENDYSALVVLGVFRGDDGNPKIMLMTCWQARLTLNDAVNKIAATCRKFKIDKLIVEAKATGISVAQEIRRIHGVEEWPVELFNPKGDKVARAYSVQHLFEEKIIYAPDREWADLMIQTASKFPKGTHDDLVDAVVMGLLHLRSTGWALRRAERAAATADIGSYASIKAENEPLPYDV